MIAAESSELTLEQVADDLGFTHKHRVKTVLRLRKKGLKVTDLGYRTKRVSKLNLLKFKHQQQALEKTTKGKR
jgi:hypothetical protein